MGRHATPERTEFAVPLPHDLGAAVTAWLNKAPELFVRDCSVCADPRHRYNIRIVNETPTGNLFAYNMFLRPTEEELEEAFSRSGKVVSVALPVDRETGRKRGFAFVEMSTDDEAQKCIEGMKGGY